LSTLYSILLLFQSGQADSKTTPRVAALTALESSAQGIGDRLRVIDDYQTHHRLREATARKRAEDMNDRVLHWSIGQAAIIVMLGLAQVRWSPSALV
jgi:hypothetical protein